MLLKCNLRFNPYRKPWSLTLGSTPSDMENPKVKGWGYDNTDILQVIDAGVGEWNKNAMGRPDSYAFRGSFSPSFVASCIANDGGGCSPLMFSNCWSRDRSSKPEARSRPRVTSGQQSETPTSQDGFCLNMKKAWRGKGGKTYEAFTWV